MRRHLPRWVLTHSSFIVSAVLTTGPVLASEPPQTKGVAAASPQVTAELRDIEVKRFAAMVQRDGAALQKLLADELTYVRPSGKSDSKVEFINAIVSGTSIYKAIEPVDQQVRVYGSVALINGVAKMTSEFRSSALGVHDDRYTAVYVQRDGRWQLTAWEATRMETGKRAAP